MTIPLTETKLEDLSKKTANFVWSWREKNILADKALLSIGRVPDLDGIGEVEFRSGSWVVSGQWYMETSVPGIYAPGDINGTKMLAHAAFRMG